MTADWTTEEPMEGVSVLDLTRAEAAPNRTALEFYQDRAERAWAEVTQVEHELAGMLTAAAMAGVETVALDVIAWAQDMRRLLSSVESNATRWAALSTVLGKTGEMPDGRTYEVKRGANRKAWDHDGWKRAYRAHVISETGATGGEVVVPSTGEVVNLYDLARDLDAATGSSAPKVTVLRKVGVDPDDYCETSSGAWSVAFAEPAADDA